MAVKISVEGEGNGRKWSHSNKDRGDMRRCSVTWNKRVRLRFMGLLVSGSGRTTNGTLWYAYYFTRTNKAVKIVVRCCLTRFTDLVIGTRLRLFLVALMDNYVCVADVTYYISLGARITAFFVVVKHYNYVINTYLLNECIPVVS